MNPLINFFTLPRNVATSAHCPRCMLNTLVHSPVCAGVYHWFGGCVANRVEAYLPNEAAPLKDEEVT